MDTNRMKKAAEWFYSNVFRDEAIRPRAPQSAERLPSLLRSARSLESGISGTWQSREALFVKQGKLLANYEDDYAYDGNVLRYYPTYQSLTDRELRAYFSWRTKLRRGEMRKTSLSFAFLYIYELINQIGVTDPMDGYRKLKEFQRRYGELDRGILPHLNTWLTDYVVYYGLSPELLADSPQVAFDRSLAVLADIKNHSSAQIMEAVRALSPRWLERSKFYKACQQDMDAVIPRVLRRVSEHCDARCKRSMVEQYFGPYTNSPARLFNAAVFFDRLKDRICEYAVDEVRIYRCKNGVWSVQKYVCSERSGPKLDALIKTIDSVMRECYGYRYGVRRELDTKWLLKLIQEEVGAFLAEKKAAEARKVTIDYSVLSKIRRDAAVTRDKLIVEEELEEDAPEEECLQEPAPSPLPEPAGAGDCPLNQAEYRLLQCLLYGRDCGWVQAEGYMLSVLTDSINEKLYDIFSDTVLTLDDRPEPVEDYMDDLKEMVRP